MLGPSKLSRKTYKGYLKHHEKASYQQRLIFSFDKSGRPQEIINLLTPKQAGNIE